MIWSVLFISENWGGEHEKVMTKSLGSGTSDNQQVHLSFYVRISTRFEEASLRRKSILNDFKKVFLRGFENRQDYVGQHVSRLPLTIR